MSFGGKSWPINPQDINLGSVSSSSNLCAGGIFDLTAGSSIGAGGGNPSWVVGAAFLKNVYSVFRYQPAGVGFAELSNAAGGSSGECRNWARSSRGNGLPCSRRFQLIKALLFLEPPLPPPVVPQALHRAETDPATAMGPIILVSFSNTSTLARPVLTLGFLPPSCNSVQDFIRDTSGGRRPSACLFALKDTKSAVL